MHCSRSLGADFVADDIGAHQLAYQVAPGAGCSHAPDKQPRAKALGQRAQPITYRPSGIAAGRQILIVQHLATVAHQHQVGAGRANVDAQPNRDFCRAVQQSRQ